MPYDSATGSSGPAHQACEYGVPIVCADIEDLRGMAAGEGMAVRFHRKGDAVDLAAQLIAILQSPDQQRQMAEHNFMAGVEMTMTSVVKNYLRWFELHKCKRAIRKAVTRPGSRRAWLRALRAQDATPNWSLHAVLLTQRKDGMDDHHGIAPAGNSALTEEVVDLLSWTSPKAAKGPANIDEPQRESI
jgi:hypothetical protein